ncbi:hypothetical protein G9A89_016622 [Geosiphon pyriformis]|nr:hypothetical protein G9A89_016622 [Geosiphon pyriformis]
MIRESKSKLQLQILNSEPLLKSRSLSTILHSNSTTINLPNLSTSYLPATAASNISATTNSNSTTQSNPDVTQKPKTKNSMVVYQPISSLSNHTLGSHSRNLGNRYNQNQSSQNYLSLLVIPEDALTNNNLEISLKQTINNNIPPATVTNDKSLTAIFLFKIEEPTKTPLFSRATLDTKPITAMYTNAKINGQTIKLILDSGLADSYQVDHAASTRIIIADEATKTPIDEIDNFFIKVNDIIVSIKILVMEATQYQALIGNDWLQNGQHTRVLTTYRYFKTITTTPLIEFEKEEKKPIWEAYQEKKKISHKKIQPTKLPVAGEVPIQLTPNQNHPISHSSTKTAGKSCPPWELGLCLTKTTGYGLIIIANYAIVNAMATQNAKANGYLHDESEIWRMANTKIEGVLPSEILEIKNNFSEPVEVYCNECDLIYNPIPCRIYTIPEEKKPISSCTLELDSTFNPDLKPDDVDNNGFSLVQNGNSNNNSNLNSDSDSEQYITLLDLSKKQKLRWFSDNDEGIMPECVHDTDAEFDLRYLEKDTIKLELHSCTCIDLKVALEIPITIMIQLASRNSLAKKGISIRGGIIDTEYIRNIIAMLQNDSEKTYIIEPNKKIAQAIFLPLVKISQLISVRNREELRITVRKIQRFRSKDKIDVPVNMAEEKIIDKRKIISTCQLISIPPYD